MNLDLTVEQSYHRVMGQINLTCASRGCGLELQQPSIHVLKRPRFLYNLEHAPISERSSGGQL